MTYSSKYIIHHTMKNLSNHIAESFIQTDLSEFEIKMIHQFKLITCEMQSMHIQGKTLDQIRNWTYEMRESGHQMPYFPFGQKSKNPNEAYIFPQPTVKQKDFKQFLDMKAPGAVSLSKYSLYVYGNGIVEFISRDKTAGTLVKTKI